MASRSGFRMNAVSAALAQRSFSLRLYKAILVAHRSVLPPVMRDLGDSYLREEWKKHKTAAPQHLRPFFEQWMNYLEFLKSQQQSNLASVKKILDSPTVESLNFAFGRPLEEETIATLSEEQKAQLNQLKQETLSAGRRSMEAEIDRFEKEKYFSEENPEKIEPIDKVKV